MMIHRTLPRHSPLRIQYDDESGDLQVAVPPDLAKDGHWESYGETFLQALMDTLAEIAGEEETGDREAGDGGR
jgi:hypothetical protein